jgi:hypothetical protein
MRVDESSAATPADGIPQEAEIRALLWRLLRLVAAEVAAQLQQRAGPEAPRSDPVSPEGPRP